MVGAPMLVSGGTAALTTIGVSAANAAAFSSATVTLGLFTTGIVGFTSLSVDTFQAYLNNDIPQLAFNLATLAGGFAVGGSGGGRYLTNQIHCQIGKPPTDAPKTWNIYKLLQYDYKMQYNYQSFPGVNYWASAPTPIAGGFTATTSIGMYHTPSQLQYVYNYLAPIWNEP